MRSPTSQVIRTSYIFVILVKELCLAVCHEMKLEKVRTALLNAWKVSLSLNDRRSSSPELKERIIKPSYGYKIRNLLVQGNFEV